MRWTPISGTVGTMPPVPDPRRWLVLATMVLCAVVVVLDGPLVGVALPSLQRGLATTQGDLVWVVDGWLLAFAAVLALGRTGGRLSLLVGLGLVASASAGSAVAPSAGWLMVARALAGAGAGVVLICALSVLTGTFGPAARSRALAIWGGFTGLLLVAGPAIGGGLLAAFWWGSVFVTQAVVAVLALLAVWSVVPRPDPRMRRPVAGRPATVVAFPAEAHRRPVADLVGISGGSGFSGRSSSRGRSGSKARSGRSSSWARRLAPPASAGATLAAALASLLVAGWTFCLTFYLQDVRHLTPLRAGLVLLPMMVAVLWTTPRAAGLATRFGSRAVCAGGLLLVSAALAGHLLVGRGSGNVLVGGLVLLMGGGAALVLTAATRVAESSATRSGGVTGRSEARSTAVAGRSTDGSALVMTVARLLGAALGVAVLGALLAASYRSHVDASLHRIPGAAAESIGGAQRAAAAVSNGKRDQLLEQADRAFVSALHTTALGAAALALLGAAATAPVLPGRVLRRDAGARGATPR